MKKLLLAVTIMLLLNAGVACAGAFEDGQAANGREDWAEGARLFRLAAKQGDVRALSGLGFLYELGLGVVRSDVEAIKWYRLAAEKGDASSQFDIGFRYTTGVAGLEQNYAKAVIWYRLSAAQGYAAAQYYLGRAYAVGDGVTRDNAEALKWYRLAASQGYELAQVPLGRMYDRDGVARNYAEAVRWYRIAAARGDAEGRFRLGNEYYDGSGVTQDRAEAVKWYRLAAAQGNDGAQLCLGVSYLVGDGVAKDSVEAFKWMKLAAAQGGKHAMAVFGLFYDMELGAGRDYVRAYMWLTLAGIREPKDGHTDKLLGDITAKLAPQQLAEAQAMVQECEEQKFQKCDLIQPASDTTPKAPPRAIELSWSGNNTSNTRPFGVDGPWELHWAATGDLFSIIIRSEAGDMVGVGANQTGSGDGSSFQPKGGRYFLAVSGIGQWHIWITPP